MRDSHVRHLLATWRELDDETLAHVEEHLSTCPECRATLQDFKEQDALLRNLSVVRPRYAWQQQVRARVGAARPTRRPRLSHRAGLVIALLVVFIAMSMGTVAVSAEALPGDFLYAVKRTVEQVNLVAIRDRDRETEYLAELAERRREEARRVLELKRQVSLQFDGVLQQDDQGMWTIDDIPVQIDPGTVANAGIEPGDAVQIDGLAASGELKVLRITERHQYGQPSPPDDAAPAPTETFTLAPTSAPTQTPDEGEPSPTALDAGATETPTDTPSARPEWTATRTPAQDERPSATPLPPGNARTVTPTRHWTRTPGVGVAPAASRTVTPSPTRTRPSMHPGMTRTVTPLPTHTRPSTSPGATLTVTPRPTRTRPQTQPGATRTRPPDTPAPTTVMTPPIVDPGATPTRPPAVDIPTATPVGPGIVATPRVGASPLLPPPPPPTAAPERSLKQTLLPVRETPTPLPIPPSINLSISMTPSPER